MERLRTIVYGSRWVGGVLRKVLNAVQGRMLAFYAGDELVGLIRKITRESDMFLYPYEAFTVYSIARSQSKLEGDMAEVGVYRGGSSKLIAEAKGDRGLHLFDTFAGLPAISSQDTHFGIRFWTEREFENTSEEAVRAYLRDYSNIFAYKGLFPATASPIQDKRFSFVHLDVDLYESTLNALEFFYPRLVVGGIILTHDYHTNGVRAAFAKYLSDTVTPMIPLNGSQCMVVKTASA